MSTMRKRKADEDNQQLSSKSPNKKNRSLTSNDSNASEKSNSAMFPPLSAPTSHSNQSSSSASSRLWNPVDGLDSTTSFSTNGQFAMATVEHSSMMYNPNHQKVKEVDIGGKRGVSTPTNFMQTPEKKPKNNVSPTLPTPPPSTDNQSKALKMMAKMGFDNTRGLGRNAQGPTQIVEESKQKGHRGLGYTVEGFNDEAAEWDFDTDPAPVEEEVHWCPPSEHTEDPLNIEEIRQWIKLEPKKKVIDDEVEFCDGEILQDMLSAKTVFDNLAQKEMEDARARSNIYETIGGSIFQNRAAVKMANIDHVFHRMFTEPRTPDNQRSLINPDEPLYFADVCAGPGGFSEYILWRKQWHARGFGFTLRGKDDFKLHKFIAGTPETFDTYYGVNGLQGDGNIYIPENIDALQNYVNKCTMNRGVHIMMADGGFSVEGQENIQEILSKQLYLCQFLTALTILRPGGHFVCKLFDTFTPFSVGLIYLMYRTFHHVSLHKPVTSRPANSERYIICKSLRGSIRDIVRPYLYEINVLQNKYSNESEPNDVQSIVPMSILKENERFCEYIRNSNDQMGLNQIRNLKKIRAFASNATLQDMRQHEVRSQCLQYWQLPDEPRQKTRGLNLLDVKNNLFYQLDGGIESIIVNLPSPLKSSVLDTKQIQSLFDYRCVLSLGDPVLLLSCGLKSIFVMDLKSPNKSWTPLEPKFQTELPQYTLLLAERVEEHVNDTRNNRSKSTIYVIDAYFIGNQNMLIQNGRPVILMDRYRTLKIFEKAINKPVRNDLAPIRISEQFRLEQMDNQLQKLCLSGTLDQIDSERLYFTNTEVENRPHVLVRGLWIFKFVQHPWTILLSKSTQQKYFHDQIKRTSVFEPPHDSSHAASLRSTLENSFYWDFNRRGDTLTKSAFISFIREKNHETQVQQRPNHHSAAHSQ
ncbi:unnamed protein product [Adineta ricciae]|uniref:Cap-specific mRNA (nucleoside-2'-O-)-methyltransferase 1 n=1 Tax=Adineta ricciae TaxID=249248 RepID=A0A815BQC3_ADIRI|nr:unnamed protein product [Adineta ricciae]